MTITVSIEELRDYQTRCIKWGIERAEVVAKTAMTMTITQRGGFEFEKKVNAPALEAWLKANPFPKLIPSV